MGEKQSGSAITHWRGALKLANQRIAELQRMHFEAAIPKEEAARRKLRGLRSEKESHRSAPREQPREGPPSLQRSTSTKPSGEAVGPGVNLGNDMRGSQIGSPKRARARSVDAVVTGHLTTMSRDPLDGPSAHGRREDASLASHLLSSSTHQDPRSTIMTADNENDDSLMGSIHGMSTSLMSPTVFTPFRQDEKLR
jgi:hypothetical protein